MNSRFSYLKEKKRKSVTKRQTIYTPKICKYKKKIDIKTNQKKTKIQEYKITKNDYYS